MKKKKNAILLAIVGDVKVPVSEPKSHQKTQELRRELIQQEEHFDMLGIPTCSFRIKNV